MPSVSYSCILLYSPWDTSHCANIISLANPSTVVREVATQLANLAAYWVQTGSDFPVLFAKAIPPRWAKQHQPVLSQHEHDPARFTNYIRRPTRRPFLPGQDEDHILFTKFSFKQPVGMLCPCYQKCERPIKSRPIPNHRIQLTCTECDDVWAVPATPTDRSTALGHASLVAVVYPQRIYPLRFRDYIAGLLPPSQDSPTEEAAAQLPTFTDPAEKPSRTGGRQQSKAKGQQHPRGRSQPGKKSNTSAKPAQLRVMDQKSSLPSSTLLPSTASSSKIPIATTSRNPPRMASTSMPPSPKSRQIRIPRQASTPTFLHSEPPTSRSASCSAASTPPPPSPQLEPQSQPPKRPPTRQTSRPMLQKRPRKDKQAAKDGMNVDG